MSKPKTKRWLSSFDEIKDLGAGGNADVYLVTERKSINKGLYNCCNYWNKRKQNH